LVELTAAEWSPEDAGEPGNGRGSHQKAGKARFDHIYNQPDPRQYFQTLQPVGYATPAHGQAVFSRLIEARRAETGREQLNVLDLCCSYGVNAALLNHELTLDDLYRRYTGPDVAGLSTSELVTSDLAFYRERRREQQVTVVGADTAHNAVEYAVQAGLLAAGDSENLEEVGPSRELARRLPTLDLITVTGGIGYISERTFARVLEATAPENPPWVAAFALRWVPFEPIATVLARHGLVSEKLTGRTFVQRRFADGAERSYVLGELARLGIDATGRESEGRYHADLYVARPPRQASAQPLDKLLAELASA
jgi:hypothetical protein